MTQYVLITEWFFDAPIDAVWREIDNFRSWPDWWPDWRRLDVHGDAVQVGTRIDCAVKGALPYTLRFQLQVTRHEPPFLNEHTSSGDLVGTGRWTMEVRDGGTAVTHDWRVGTTNPILSFFGRFSFAKSMMTKNHADMMARGYEGLEARLAAKTAAAGRGNGNG